MIKPIEYFLKDTFIKQKILVIHNNTDEEKLFQVLINQELFKIIFLKPNEIKEIAIENETMSMIDVLEIQ